MSRLRKPMRASLQRLLLPELEARGFRPDRAGEPDAEMPFGTLSRVGANGTDRIVITFNRYRPGHFTLCLSVQPDRPTAGPSADVSVLYELGRRGGFRLAPFGASAPKGRAPAAADHDAAAREVVEALPEVDALFATGSASRRMRRLTPKRYGFGSHRYEAGVWIVYAIPVVLLGLIAAAFHTRIGWLLSAMPFAVLALMGWLWLFWSAHRR